jgi:hypothetical protein
MNGNKLSKNNDLNLLNIINIPDNTSNIIKFINNINNNKQFIFDQIICIHKDKNEFYYENFYEHDETSIYQK